MSSRNHLLSLLIISLLFSLSFADDNAIMSKLSAAFTTPPTGWTGPSYCGWTGIACDSSNRVTSINLPSKSLSGILPPELSQLSQLKTLALYGNSLSGTLPSFANLTSLQEIFLDSNNFTSVPDNFLKGLTNLQTVSISDNPNLSPWQIPDYLSESTNLGTFAASNSSISGTIPDIFDSFTNFQNLRLSYNNLTGVLPKTFGGSDIQNLWLNSQVNGLSGSIEVLSSMAKLSQVWLFANAFTGSVPDLSKCLNLFDLQLRDNRLTGVLPLSLTELPKLINISLQNNKLQGHFPEFKSGVSAALGDANSFCRSTPGPCDHEVNVLLAVAGAFGYPMSLAEAWTGNDACAKWTFVTCDSQDVSSEDENGEKSGSGSGLGSVIVGSEGSSTPSMTATVVIAVFVNLFM
ncbi:receptor-like kinase TMK4 [Heracleum sosnowskyi]|uniref:Receptor-like kinase TMK4 n=1 Tax=Heracleum sosnowskyi TaxID=360622 RepID=A0AAD8I8E5_9APIA|nr:receptor-like kinase TMK4 [Heracleum sosnowskyi]